MWDSYTPSTEARAIDYSDRTRNLDKAFVRSSWDLVHRQIDFDYIDRELLCAGEIRNGKLCWRDRAYSAVVMPCARVLEEDAMEKLLQLAEAGIAVLFCEELPVKTRETGECAPAVCAIAKMVESGGMFFAPTDAFGTLLDEHLPQICRTITTESASGAYQPMLLSHCRSTEDGLRIVYIANMAAEPYTGTLHVAGTYTETCEADSFTGDILPASCITENGRTTMQITIQPGEGRFFLLQK